MEIDKFVIDLKNATRVAKEVGWQTEDNGTCNLDHCIIQLKGEREKTVEQCCRLAGLTASKNYWRKGGWYSIYGYEMGQANQNTKMVEAFAKYLKEHGWNAYVDYVID